MVIIAVTDKVMAEIATNHLELLSAWSLSFF